MMYKYHMLSSEEYAVGQHTSHGALLMAYLQNVAVNNGADGAGAQPRADPFEETRFPIDLHDVLG